jgi:hypothetical protein
MAHICGNCLRRMGFGPEHWELGDFGELIEGMRDGEEAMALCDECGWIVIRRIDTESVTMTSLPAQNRPAQPGGGN